MMKEDGTFSQLSRRGWAGRYLLLLHADVDAFRTGWFVESVVSAALIVLVIRTRLPFFRSQPARSLLPTMRAVVTVVLALPYLPVAGLLGFTPLFLSFLPVLVGILAV